MKFDRVCGEFEERNNHSQNIWDKLQFLCEIAHYGKGSISAFFRFLLVLAKFSFQGDLALGNNSIKFWDFSGIS